MSKYVVRRAARPANRGVGESGVTAVGASVVMEDRMERDGDDDADVLHALDFASLSSLLNQETNALTESFSELEEALIASGANAPAAVLIESEQDEHTGITIARWLNFSKYDGRWCLTIVKEVEDEVESELPIAKTSREVRILAAEHIPELRLKLRESMIEEIKRVRIAKELNRRQRDEMAGKS